MSYLDTSKKGITHFWVVTNGIIMCGIIFQLKLKVLAQTKYQFLIIQYSIVEFSKLSTRIVSRYMELVQKQVIKIII